jgi:N-acetylneuraminate synthase/N,N'-diacetyllegionaminate synthase
MIVSTGMSTLGEIEEAVQVINNFHNELILLHCNFNYPAKVKEINLMAMETLEKAFDVPIGYSDHTLGVEVSLAAVALKATVLEKHFTLNRKLPGPDQRASLEPDELKELVRMVRNVEKALGSAKKEPTETEKPNRHISRRSLVADKDIPKRSIITQDVIAIKRPGMGIPPKFYNLVVGRQAICEIKKDELLTWDKVK